MNTEDNTQQREHRRISGSPLYLQAQEHAQQFMRRIASFLSADKVSYQYGKTTRTLRDIGQADVTMTATPTLTGPECVPDGERFNIRIYLPGPGGAVVYAAAMKDSPDQAQRVYRRLRQTVGRARGGQARRKQPTIMDAAKARVLATAAAFGPKAEHQCGQAKVNLPGGAVLHVSGDRDHTVAIHHLSDRQLQAVLRAIAETTKAEREPGD